METAALIPSSYPDAASSRGIGLKLYAADQWQWLAETWSALLESAAQPSFFLSRRWVETWLEVFGSKLHTSIALFEAEGRPVAACLLTRSRRRYGLIPLRRMSLNASGEHLKDTTYIEFNDIVCRKEWEEGVVTRLVQYLMAAEWDEFALDGFVPGPRFDGLKRALAQFDLEEVRQPSYYVDLASLRRTGQAYEAMLKSHRRRMVHQHVRAYSEGAGPLQLESARDEASALAMFEELARLNRRRFAKGGRRSAFESPDFVEFHRRLISRCLGDGSVELLRLKAGESTIGILYHLISGGKVYFYQCGFDYTLNPKLSPGVVSLAHGISYCLDRGYDDFDFLSGEANYKRMLASGSRELVWAVFRKRSIGIRVITATRNARRHRMSLVKSRK